MSLIKETKDYEMIKKMLWDDSELFDRISDDYTSKDTCRPENSVWLGWFQKGDCKALLSITQENAIVLNIHMYIPEKNRGKNSFKMGNGLIDHLVKTCDKRFVKINAKIPDNFKDVIKFGIKCGFTKEGVDRHSHIKNGQIFDRVIMGKVIK